MCVQWEQMADRDWATENCRMVPEVHFSNTGSSVPASDQDGLDVFYEHFAMRARTQLRFAEDVFNADFKMRGDDGWAFSLLAVGVSTTGGDRFFAQPRVVTTMSRPGPGGCQTFTRTGINLFKGVIYSVDVKYWQRTGGKCLMVRGRRA